MPLVGIRCRLDAMLMTACSPNWINSPVADNSTNRLPSCSRREKPRSTMKAKTATMTMQTTRPNRSEEHTSELQSLRHLVCRLLLEKKKKQKANERDANSI